MVDFAIHVVAVLVVWSPVLYYLVHRDNRRLDRIVELTDGLSFYAYPCRWTSGPQLGGRTWAELDKGEYAREVLGWGPEGRG